MINTHDALRLCNVEDLNAQFIKIKHLDLGLQFDATINMLSNFENTKITEPTLLLSDTININNVKHANVKNIMDYSKCISCIYITNSSDSNKQMDLICKSLEQFYTQFGCEWKSEIVVSGCLETASAKEYIIIGTTPINKQKITLAKIKHTTNYYSHKLSITDKNGHDAHTILIDMINNNALFPFIVELFEINYFRGNID